MGIVVGHDSNLPPAYPDDQALALIANDITRRRLAEDRAAAADQENQQRYQFQDYLQGQRLDSQDARQQNQHDFRNQYQQQGFQNKNAILEKQLQQNKDLFDYKLTSTDQRKMQMLSSNKNAVEARIAQQQAIIDNPASTPEQRTLAGQRMYEFRQTVSNIEARAMGIKAVPVAKPPPPDPEADMHDNARWRDAAGNVQTGMAPPGIPYMLRDRGGNWKHVENPLSADAIEAKKIEAEQRRADLKDQKDMVSKQRAFEATQYHDYNSHALEYRQKLGVMEKLAPVEVTGADGKKTTEYQKQPMYTPEEVDAMVHKLYPPQPMPSWMRNPGGENTAQSGQPAAQVPTSLQQGPMNIPPQGPQGPIPLPPPPPGEQGQPPQAGAPQMPDGADWRQPQPDQAPAQQPVQSPTAGKFLDYQDFSKRSGAPRETNRAAYIQQFTDLSPVIGGLAAEAANEGDKPSAAVSNFLKSFSRPKLLPLDKSRYEEGVVYSGIRWPDGSISPGLVYQGKLTRLRM